MRSKPSSTISRRAFLGGTVVAAAALLPSGLRALGIGGKPPPAVTELSERLQGLLDDPRAAAGLGWAYLDGLSRWPTQEELVSHLLPQGSSVETARSSDARMLREGLKGLRRADYLGGRLVSYDGWLVSETEGRLAALFVVR